MLSSSLHAKSQSSNGGDDDDDMRQQSQEQNQGSGPAAKNWLEEWALEGAKKIAQLDIQERTQRVMLAEMAEDKIYELNIALEELIDEETGEILDLVQAKDIAQQTRSLQIQYRALVTGGPSSMLQAIASLKGDGQDDNGDIVDPTI
jgi:hypothetical protein